MLSALDAEILNEWAERKVPPEVVMRGIRRAAEALMWDKRPDERTLKSLRACRRQVEAEWKKHQQTALGETREGVPQKKTEPVHIKRHSKLLETLRKSGNAGAPVQKALNHLRSIAPPFNLTEAQKNEEWAYVLILRALPFEERLSLLREARELSQDNPAVSWHARRMSVRFHRAAVLRRHVALPSFW